jgi:hypothetical protein
MAAQLVLQARVRPAQLVDALARAVQLLAQPLAGLLELLAQALAGGLELLLEALALGGALGLDLLDAPACLGQVGAQRACRPLDRVRGAGIGQRRLERGHARLDLVGPLGRPALVGDRRLESCDLGARLLDLAAQVLLRLRRAREVAPDAIDGRADGLQLVPQALALGAALLGLALQALALLAHLVDVRAAGLLQPLAQAVDLGAHLVE